MNVIGLTGKKGVGKNEVASAAGYPWRVFYDENGGGAVNITNHAFAEPLKEAAKILFGIADANLYGSDEHKQALTKQRWEDYGGETHYDSDKTGFMTVREVLQTFGTEVIRGMYGDDFWITHLQHKLDGRTDDAGALVFITDVRFPNEVKLIRERYNGMLWRVEGPIRSGVTAATGHSSETALDGVVADYTVDNSKDGWPALQRRILAGFKETKANGLMQPSPVYTS